MPENQQNYKQVLEWVAKIFVYLAPILIGFLGMTAYNSLRETITRKKFFAQLAISVAVGMAVYELLKIWPKWEPFTGVIVGLCSAFAMVIVEVAVNNVPGMLKELLRTVFGIAQKRLEDKKNDVNNN